MYGISSSRNRIKVNQEELDSVGTFRGLRKDGKRIKQLANNEIQRHESIVKEHKRKLEPYREKYGFRSESEFKVIHEKYQSERPALREQSRTQRGAIKRERDVLQKANSALKNRFIQEVASRYSNNPEMAHMDYKTAQRIDYINKEFGKTFSVKELKHLKEFTENADSTIRSLKDQKSCLNQMDKGDTQLEQQKEKIDFSIDKYTQVKELTQRSGGLFNGIIQGIEQAQRSMEHHKQQGKKKSKQKQKYKQK